ncbi:MAG: VCBS repeat-containing protein [Chloroflexota bacterium]
MNHKYYFLFIPIFVSIALVFNNPASAEPESPPCLTTDLCFEEAVKATNFNGASDIAVGYLNNGTNLDFVTTGWSSDKIRIKTGSGNGAFWGTWTWSMGDGTYEVETADFNGDGHTDIIASNGEQDRVFIRWGHTGWANASVWTVDNHPHYLAVGDLNNDGLDDFATGNTTGNETITVRLRKPGGGFALGTTYSASHFLNDVAFNDCDNDGDLDMFYSGVFTDPFDQETFVYVRKNDGSGNFSLATAIDMDSEGYGINIGSLTFGDLDEDGWDDLVATRNDHKLIRVLGGSNCNFHSPVVSTVQSNPYSVEMADMNQDGDLDLVVSHSLNQLITIYLGQGNGNMTGPYEPELNMDWHVRDIGLGDFNNDGLTDIVYAEDSGVWLLLAREDSDVVWTPPWVIQNGITYTTAGNATLDLKQNELFLANMGTSGEDGVDIHLEEATSWSADLALEGRIGAQVEIDATANEQQVGKIQLVGTDSGLELRPHFRTTDFRVIYLLDGEPQLEEKYAAADPVPVATVNWDELWCIMDLPIGIPSEICRLAFEYGVDPEDLYNVVLDFPLPLVVSTADGNRVKVNQIQIIEIPGNDEEQEASSLSRIELRGGMIDSIVLANSEVESVFTNPFSLYLPIIIE